VRPSLQDGKQPVVSLSAQLGPWAGYLNACTTLTKERGCSPISFQTQVQLIARFSEWLRREHTEVHALDEIIVDRFLLPNTLPWHGKTAPPLTSGIIVDPRRSVWDETLMRFNLALRRLSLQSVILPNCRNDSLAPVRACRVAEIARLRRLICCFATGISTIDFNFRRN